MSKPKLTYATWARFSHCMFDLFVGHESIHNIFKWNRINGGGTEQNEWNGMNEIKYTRLELM